MSETIILVANVWPWEIIKWMAPLSHYSGHIYDHISIAVKPLEQWCWDMLTTKCPCFEKKHKCLHS